MFFWFPRHSSLDCSLGSICFLQIPELFFFFPGSENSEWGLFQIRIKHTEDSFLPANPRQKRLFFPPRRICSREYVQEVMPVTFLFILAETSKWHLVLKMSVSRGGPGPRPVVLEPNPRCSRKPQGTYTECLSPSPTLRGSDSVSLALHQHRWKTISNCGKIHIK